MNKTIKGRAVVEFLALYPKEEQESFKFEFPDEGLNVIEIQEWKLYFNGVVNNKGASIGVVLITPEGENIPLPVVTA